MMLAVWKHTERLPTGAHSIASWHAVSAQISRNDIYNQYAPTSLFVQVLMDTRTTVGDRRKGRSSSSTLLKRMRTRRGMLLTGVTLPRPRRCLSSSTSPQRTSSRWQVRSGRIYAWLQHNSDPLVRVLEESARESSECWSTTNHFAQLGAVGAFPEVPHACTEETTVRQRR
jgi:hypothetical protein